MTKEEIIEIAKQSGAMFDHMTWVERDLLPVFECFAKLVEKKVREECVKICDERVTAYQYATDPWAQEHIDEARHLSKAIKERGQE